MACTTSQPALLGEGGRGHGSEEASGGRWSSAWAVASGARPSWSAFGYDGARHVADDAEAMKSPPRSAVTFEGGRYRDRGGKATEVIPRGARAEHAPLVAPGLREQDAGRGGAFGVSPR